ncbi:hypothetical protein ABEI56_04995 [Peribacillus castrilensis]|uniref:hypothetical protein n=1 Tax=Peribacillus TaxID=2675229 RepID=UPI003871E144
MTCREKHASHRSREYAQKVYDVAIGIPIDRLIGRLSFLPERFGYTTDWKVSRSAMFYNSKDKGKK